MIEYYTTGYYIFKVKDTIVCWYDLEAKDWELQKCTKQDLLRFNKSTQLTLLDLDMMGVVE